MIDGVVLRSVGGIYHVEVAEGVKEAVLRGKLRNEERLGDRVVVGDHVTIQEPGRAGESWTIESVRERTTALVRRAPGKGERAKVIAANIDRVVIVFAVANPAPHLGMLDRFLVLCESSDLEAVIVANKTDLLPPGEAERLFGLYESIGYRVLYTSASRGMGTDALRDLVCSGVTAFTGPSGVGKSSLLNRIQPRLGLRVGAVSESARKGRHTTVSAELIHLDCGGFVADTPGLRELGLWRIDEDSLDSCFPDFAPFLDSCRYRGSCSHRHEPDCGVIRAVETGEIDRARYSSYLKIGAGE